MKSLVIVESPAKAGTIGKILGKDYFIASSFGHIRDLAKDGEGSTGVDVHKKYKPHYIVAPSKAKVVKDLKTLAKKYSLVLLATDEDREGEAIAWHLFDELKLKKANTKRITFTEITSEAILNATQNPRDIDLDLVDAQQARRILDRLVGFELSRLLWKKVRGKLSAGRVQSVAVRLIVEREREIQQHESKKFYKVTGLFGTTHFEASLSEDLPSHDTSEKFLKSCSNAVFTVHAVDVKPARRAPAPPFTTSTLQQTAGQKLGFSVSRTMSIAQKLYEAGHITYMRTDSMHLSTSAQKKLASHILKEFGEKYLKPRQYVSKSKNAQEAHEAIRPTYPQNKHASDNADLQKLYDLIRNRALASQMAEAEVQRTQVIINISTNDKYTFISKGEIITFDGFLKAYKNTKWYTYDDIILPQLATGDTLTASEIKALERLIKPPARYSEATLVKKLEELGIGRPSTYAPTIDKITSPTRGYITKETREGIPTEFLQLTLKDSKITETVITEVTGAQKNKLFASDMGIVVTDFLVKNFENIMDYAFTAEVEGSLDHIASGNADWVKTIDTYYKPFTMSVGKTLSSAERVTGERILGSDPKSGRTILVRMSKFGPVAQIGSQDELKGDEKPDYANLSPGQSLETVTLKDVLPLFSLPKNLGTYKDKDVVVGRGKFGPYIKWGDTYISIRGTDPLTATLHSVMKSIREKEHEMEPITMYQDKPITKGVGRFGPYIKWEETFAAIPKKSGINIATITPEQAIHLMEEKVRKDNERILYTWGNGSVTLQNGRFGPCIRIKGKRKFYSLPKNDSGEKLPVEDLKKLSEKEIRKLIS